jgi:hypothetical protein
MGVVGSIETGPSAPMLPVTMLRDTTIHWSTMM